MQKVERLLSRIQLLRVLKSQTDKIKQENNELVDELKQKQLRETGVHEVRQRHLQQTLAKENAIGKHYESCVSQLDEAISNQSIQIEKFQMNIDNCRRKIQSAKHNVLTRENISQNFNGAQQSSRAAKQQYDQSIMKQKYMQSTIDRKKSQICELQGKVSKEQQKIQQLSDRVKCLITTSRQQHNSSVCHSTAEKCELKLKSLDIDIS